VIVKTPADFVGNVLGASEANTKAILDAAIGKVLVLDEAYGLCSKSDPYKAAVIDTIVAEVQSIPGDDRCVLLLGYKEQMEEMMQSVNPGLARRFPIDSGFLFEDFTDAELAVIFDAKLRSQAFTTSDKARGVALDVLGRMRNRPNFGNAGQVDILLNDAKMRQQKRIGRERIAPNAILEAEDFDPNHKRAENAAGNLETLFEGVVGCEGIVQQMHDYQNIAENAKRANMDPRSMLPFNFLFRGPPGKKLIRRNICQSNTPQAPERRRRREKWATYIVTWECWRLLKSWSVLLKTSLGSMSVRPVRKHRSSSRVRLGKYSSWTKHTALETGHSQKRP